jgi:hypothetical protein
MAKHVDLNVEAGLLKMLLYGVAGSTKTRTAATACLDERTAPVLWLDQGGNPVSIRGFAKLPDIIRVSKLADFNPIYAWLAAGQPPKDPIVEALGLQTDKPYKTVVVDGLTGVQRMSFAVVLGSTNQGPSDIPPAMEFSHHGKVLGQMQNFGYSFFYKLPMHVIMTALEQEKQDDKVGGFRYGPLIWGQSAGELPGQAQAVARMLHIERVDNKVKQALREVPEKVDSVAVFTPGPNYVAKDQYGGLPAMMYNPSVTKILDCIEKFVQSGG